MAILPANGTGGRCRRNGRSTTPAASEPLITNGNDEADPINHVTSYGTGIESDLYEPLLPPPGPSSPRNHDCRHVIRSTMSITSPQRYQHIQMESADPRDSGMGGGPLFDDTTALKMAANATVPPGSPLLTLRRPGEDTDSALNGDSNVDDVNGSLPLPSKVSRPPDTLAIPSTTDGGDMLVEAEEGEGEDADEDEYHGDGEKRGSLYRLHALHLNSLLANANGNAHALATQQMSYPYGLPPPPNFPPSWIRGPGGSSHLGSSTVLYGVPTVPPSPAGSSVHFFIGTNPTGSLASVMTGPPGAGGALTPFAPYYFQPVLLKDKYAHYYRQHLANAALHSSFLKNGGAGALGDSSASFVVSESGALVLCRICQTPGTEHSLVSPCRCAGSVRYVHKNCLTKWLEINPNRNRKFQMCELCQYTYHRKKKFKFKEWKWPHCSAHDKLFHALFLVAILIMMGCASAFIICFRKDRGVRRNDELELSEGEIVTLSCGVLFFLSFFLGMYAQIKAHSPIYKICSQTLSMNQSWIIDDYYGEDDELAAGAKGRRPARTRKGKSAGTSPPPNGDVTVSTGGGGGGYVSMIDVLPTITEQQVVMMVPVQPLLDSPTAVAGGINDPGKESAGIRQSLAFNHARAFSYTQDDDRATRQFPRYGANVGVIPPPPGRAPSNHTRSPHPASSILTRHASLPTGGGCWGQEGTPLVSVLVAHPASPLDT